MGFNLLKQVKTHSKITLSKMYVNIKQYNISSYNVFANLFSNNVRLQCKRKLSQLIAFFGSSLFIICCSLLFFLSIVFTRVNKIEAMQEMQLLRESGNPYHLWTKYIYNFQKHEL